MADNYELDTSGLDKLIRDVPGAFDAFGRSAAESITNEIKLSFNSGPAGRSYQRGSVTHVASSPGSPPNIDTGALVGSMHWETIAELTYHVMDGVEYGYDLEEGTSKILPRPFVQPVFRVWRNGKLEREAVAYGIVKP